MRTAPLTMPVQVTLLRWLDRLCRREQRSQLSAAEQTAHELAKASGSMGRYLAACEHSNIDVLDFGCGWGGETIWLAQHVRSVVGVDVERSAIDQAEATRTTKHVTNCRFVWCPDGTLPLDENSVDAVFSTDTFEHVMDLDHAFSEILRVLRPGGLIRTTFGPLFYSPYGYHLHWACQVPYAHLLFGIGPVLALRNERAGTVLEARTWEETGLNRKRFADFERSIIRAGLEIVRLERVPVRGLQRLAKLPFVGDLLTFGVDCTARKPVKPNL